MRVKLKNGSVWPNPLSDEFQELSQRLCHDHKNLTSLDFYHAARIMGAYNTLITHPAFTLKKVQKIVSEIRRAVK